MALGAQRQAGVVADRRGAFVQLAIGLAIGMPGAFGVGKLLRESARPDQAPRSDDAHLDCAAPDCGRRGGVLLAGPTGDAAGPAGALRYE